VKKVLLRCCAQAHLPISAKPLNTRRQGVRSSGFTS
jgi:hypothetical protein